MSFRWEWILVPLACLAMAWILTVIRPAGAWVDVMNVLHVRDRGSYSMLACLGCAVVGLVAISRALRKNDKED